MNPLRTVRNAAQVAASTSTRFGGRKRQARALVDLALSQWKQKQHAEARETAEAVLELLDSDGQRRCRERAQCLDIIGSVAVEQADSPLAVRCFGEALEIERQLRPLDWVRITLLCRRRAEATRASGDLAGTRRLFEEAVESAERGLSADHPVIGDCLADFGTFLQQTGEHGASLACYERATELHRAACGLDSPEVARDYQGLALAFHGMGRFEEAAEYYQKALYRRERQLGGDGSEVAVLMVNLAQIYSDWGRHSSALELLQQATGRLECKGDERLAQTLEKLGALYGRCGRYEDAAGCYTRARKVWIDTPGDHQAELEGNAELMSGIVPHLRPEDLEPPQPRVTRRPDSRGAQPAGRPPVTECEEDEREYRVPIGVAPSAPLVMRHLALKPVLVPDTPPLPAIAVAAIPEPPSAEVSARLSGWDELDFEFLSSTG